MDLSYVSKPKALKRKAVDLKTDIKKMEETLSMLKDKQKNYSLKTLNLYSMKNFSQNCSDIESWTSFCRVQLQP